ncbi:ribosome hibernation-promoting factor, HPF/YfiA family [Arenibacter latericius]|uniref:ribosome hibernation-promoting factor, HPF/YfiA family n=1 Tax=Arenibacter latericius TaxID=86104 RepID=UPI0003FB8ECD|nr:ribosome-associated translation inhibitor RaiA [Arenibacter latericius]MDX1365499.1 ribosome-associated translation inhibitor RaiA [Arenibacter latericius]
MNINFEYVDVKASARLEELATKKLEKLEDKYDFIVRADVFLKKENNASNKGFICSIKLSAPGPLLFSETNSTKFEMSIADSIEDLERQLEKRKGKLRTH